MTKDEILKALESVIDPELRRSIVELDMVRSVEIRDGGVVDVMGSLTTPGCPIRNHFQTGVTNAVRTIEGLSGDGSHPVQRAWAQADVVQCGYCQSGQIMTTVALLAKNPDPSDSDIDAALSGNICRCGTYVRIREAVHLAARLSKGGGK